MKEVKNYLILAGVVGATYFAYNHFTQKTIPLKLTQKIAQEIKHQMLIVTINFADGISKHASGPGGVKVNEEKVNEYFVEELGKIYKQKEELILSKYSVSSEVYKNSLARYGKNKHLTETTDEIVDMMQRSVKGIVPDLTVTQEATYSFSKEQIKEIYLNMCMLIARKVSQKLLEEKKKNPYFDPNDDTVFRKAIRQLSIYDVKVDFLKGEGFKESWGCPNETFFKISEGLKLNDAAFKEKMVKIQKKYEKVIDMVSKDPESVNPQQIEEHFVDKAPEPQVVLSSSVNAPERVSGGMGGMFAKLSSSAKESNMHSPVEHVIVPSPQVGKEEEKVVIEEPAAQEQILDQQKPVIEANIEQKPVQESIQVEKKEEEEVPLIVNVQENKPEYQIKQQQKAVAQEQVLVEDSVPVEEPVVVQEPVSVQQPVNVQESANVQEPAVVQIPAALEESAALQEKIQEKNEQQPKEAQQESALEPAIAKEPEEAQKAEEQEQNEGEENQKQAEGDSKEDKKEQNE